MTWIIIWKVVLLVCLVLFAGLAIATTILGAGDIRRLFQRLEDERNDRD